MTTAGSSPQPSPSDEEVLSRLVAGDTEAFSLLVRRHQARVRLLCLVRLANAEEADDAAQTVFVKAFQSLKQFKAESTFSTWILRIADNQCIDVLRHRKRQRTESLDRLFEENGDAVEALVARANSAEAPPINTDDLSLLSRLFAALPDDDREVLSLREVEELPYEAIASRLHISLDAVKGRLKRARQALMGKCRGLKNSF